MNAADASRMIAAVESAGGELQGLDAKKSIQQIEGQRETVKAAFDWLLDHGQADDALRIAVALYDFWTATGTIAEGRAWIDRGLRAHDVSDETRARALYRLGMLAFWQGDDVTATSSFEESLDLARQMKDPRAIAVALAARARVALRADDLEDSRRLCLEALATVEGTDEQEGRSNALHVLSVTAQMQGNLPEARELMNQRLDLAREQGNFRGVAVESSNLSHVERRLGNRSRAETLARDALEIAVRRDDSWMVPYTLNAIAACAVEARQFERAARMLGAAARMVDEQAAAWPPDEAPLFEQSRQAASQALGPEQFAVTWSAGRAMNLPAAVAYALDRDN